MSASRSIPEDLPGADLVTAGLVDLDRGELSVPALLVLCARRRLSSSGLTLPAATVVDPGRELYRELERVDPAGAYSTYNALRRRLVSFCRALEHDARSPLTRIGGPMSLPLTSPIKPQLARGKPELPEGEEWAYEPKYDGFRGIVFVDGENEPEIQSRGEKPLRRYFPEIVFPPGRYVIDGEIVIDDNSDPDHPGQDFSALQNRMHPAESRVKLLAEQTPARFIAFDVLAIGDEVVMDRPLGERRGLLADLLDGAPGDVTITPLTRELDDCEPWLQYGEGVVAKDLRAPYKPGSRAGMVKVKRQRTIDCVVAGYRPGKEAGTVGSLMLGLYAPDGDLRVVGHSSGIRPSEKQELLDRLRPYETGARGHGEASRWKSEKEMEWVALRPELVVEITFDHKSGGRIRHGTKILRWRDDKPPRECALAQMES